jgi:hypothetical protein
LVITDGSEGMEKERNELRQEAKEFVLIFNSILKKRDSPRLTAGNSRNQDPRPK